jgi:CheY-like chemotaxis protein
VRPAVAGQVLHELINRACADAPRGGRIRVHVRDVAAAGQAGAKPGWVEFALEATASTNPQVWGQLAAPLLASQRSGGEGPRLEVARTSGKVITLRLQLPCAGRAAAQPGSGALVLVADDDALIRDSLADVLRERGYDVVAAENGEAALERVAAAERPVDLLVADIMMPRMSGIELAKRLAARQPALKILFLSALPLPRGAVLPGPLVPKPLDLSDLLHQVPSLVAGLLDAPAA